MVGVATWSLYDLSLLDALDQFVTEEYCRVDRIDVFNLDRLERGDFEQYLPGLGKVLGTPVAGHWENGILGDKGFGWQAIRLVSDLIRVSLGWNGAESRWLVSRLG